MALPPDNVRAVERAIRDLLAAIGEDPNREGIKDTPMRVAKMYSEILDGNFATIKRVTSFDEEKFDGAVMVHHIPFYALCEHHLLMFQGTFGMAYVPDKTVIGLSKLVRIFRHFTKRPTIQERITNQAVDELVRLVRPKGAICYVAAEHTCMTLRGVKSPGSLTTTIAHRGVFENDAEMRQQFVALASK